MLAPVKRFGLMPHTGKGKALEVGRQALAQLEAAGAWVVMEPEAASRLGRDDLARPASEWGRLDAVVVVGGDGALLRAARILADRSAPVLAVNVGRLGFLTEVEHGDLSSALNRLVAGDYAVEERMMLRARLFRDGHKASEMVALNDVVMNRGTFARIIRIEAQVSDELVFDFSGDGIIIATPTGSTGYSLSAGGPIIDPSVDAIILTPICPHALASRSVVVRADEQVAVRVTASHADIMVTIDGQVGFGVSPGDLLRIDRAPNPVRLVRFGPRRFYRELRERLGQGTAYTIPGEGELEPCDKPGTQPF